MLRRRRLLGPAFRYEAGQIGNGERRVTRPPRFNRYRFMTRYGFRDAARAPHRKNSLY